MSNIKISELPEFTGSVAGSWLVMDNASQTVTYKVLRENMVSTTSGTSGTSGYNGINGTNGSSGSSGSNGSSGTSGINGSSGTSGINGTSGSNGTNGSSGSSGSSGIVNYTGLITTGSLGITQSITGSLKVTGSVILTGSLTMSGSNILMKDTNSPDFYTASIAYYDTSANLIMGVNLPNNNATYPFNRFISGSHNILAGTSFATLTGSNYIPKTNQNLSFSRSDFSSYFSGSEVGQNIFLNNAYIDHSSASFIMDNNIINSDFTSNQNTKLIDANYWGPSSINNNIINRTTRLNNDSYITFANNISNGVTVNNTYTGSLSQVSIQRNIFNGTPIVNFSNAYNSTQSIGNINNSIIGGSSNLYFGSGTNSNDIIGNSIIYGTNLYINAVSSSATGGGTFFGKYNDATNNNSFNNVIFGVGTGTGIGTRKTGFYIDTGSITHIEGGLQITGSVGITGSITGSANARFNDIQIGKDGFTTNNNLYVGWGKVSAGAASPDNQYNVAVGFGPLQLNISGSDNVGLGVYSAGSNSNGSRNVAIGTYAGFSNTTGSNNISIGWQANYFGTNFENIAIGSQALQNNGSDLQNVGRNLAIGGQSLLNVTGSRNIGIGYTAGRYETGSNSFYLDTWDRSNFNGGVSGSLLYGNFNSTATNQKLRVNATTTLANTLNIETGGANITGSLNVTGGITGSLQGTSSYATQALSASYAPAASTFPYTGSAIITGSLNITGSVQGNVNSLSIASTTASLNLNDGNFFNLQLVSGSSTHLNPSNIKLGQTVSIFVNTIGSATMTFPSSVKQISGSAYVPTTSTGIDILTLISKDSSSLYLVNAQNFI